LQGNILYPTF